MKYYFLLIILFFIKCIICEIFVTPSVGYDKNTQPTKTVALDFIFEVETISEINPDKQTLTLVLGFHFRWLEPRLNITKIEDGVEVLKDFKVHFLTLVQETMVQKFANIFPNTFHIFKKMSDRAQTFRNYWDKFLGF